MFTAQIHKIFLYFVFFNQILRLLNLLCFNFVFLCLIFSYYWFLNICIFMNYLWGNFYKKSNMILVAVVSNSSCFCCCSCHITEILGLFLTNKCAMCIEYILCFIIRRIKVWFFFWNCVLFPFFFFSINESKWEFFSFMIWQLMN